MPHKRERNTKIHLGVDAFGIPIRIIVIKGTVADSSQIYDLIDGIQAQYLLADRGYDTSAVIELVRNVGIEAVNPPRRVGKNSVNIEKSWRGIATRYAKKTASYIAAIQICGIVM